MGKRRRRVVLLVDDDPRLLSGLRRALREEPYEVLLAETATAALWLMDARPVDVVVTDHHMPGLSGTDFLVQVRQRYPAVTSIMLTAHADLPTAVTAINAGEVFRFFTKPCDTVNLAAAIRQALQRTLRVRGQSHACDASHGPVSELRTEDSSPIPMHAPIFEVEPIAVNIHDLLQEIEHSLRAAADSRPADQ